MRTRTALVPLAVLLVTAAGCTAQSSEPHATAAACTTGEDAREAAQSVLDRRAAAVRDGDLPAFLATLDPDLSDNVRAQQRAWFGRVQALPDHTFELTLSVNRSTSADELTTYVNQQVQLSGIDEKPVGVVHLMTFRQRDGCWLMSADRPDQLQVAVAPWDAPGAVVTHRDGVVLVTDEADPEGRERILDAAADAWAAVRRLLAAQNRRPDDAGVVVLAFTTDAAMKANGFYHQSLDLTGGVELPVEAGGDEVDYRVLVAPSMLDDAVAPNLPALIRHEFVHVLLARHPLVPSWAAEGVADYYASGKAGGPRATLSEMVPPGSRTSGVGLADEGFYADDWASRAGNYAVAWAAMAYLGAEYGKDEPARLVRALDRVKGYYFPRRVERLLEARYALTSRELGARARELIAELRSAT